MPVLYQRIHSMQHGLIVRVYRPPQARQQLPVREVGTADIALASCRV